MNMKVSPPDVASQTSDEKTDLDVLKEVPEKKVKEKEIKDEEGAEEGEEETPEEGEEGEEPVEGEEGEGEGEKTEEEEEEGLEEEEAAEAAPYPRPSFKDITSKYPNLFKDFPDLRQVFFREKAFTERFLTVEDADEAIERSATLDNISATVDAGDVKSILEAVDEKAVTKLASNFLPALYEKNQDLYFKVIGPLFGNVVQKAYRAGLDSNNSDLTNAALWLSKWALGDAAYAKGEKALEGPKVAEDPDLDKQKREFFTQRYVEAHNSISKTVNQRLMRDIETGLEKVSLTPRMKQLVAKEVYDEVTSKLESDQRHLNQMNGLWRRAEKAGFSAQARSRIVATFLARAKALVPAVRSRVTKEVSGSSQKTNGEEKQHRVQNLSGAAPQRIVSSSTAPKDPKKVDWSKTSDLDLIKGKAVLRK